MAAQVGWVVALSAALTAFVERFGFDPTDQGFVLAQSWRILHGEMPHSDVVSARPLGSAYLHTLDFALPAPLMVSSIFVATLQLVTATVLLAAWTSGVGPTRWGVARTAVVATAAVVNLHQFPMNAWHTVDGILAVAAGWWALDVGMRRDRDVVVRLGLPAIGVAAIVKQSFVPALLITLVVLVVRRRRPAQLIPDVAVLFAVPAAYVAVVAAGGGVHDMLAQLGGASSDVGLRLLDVTGVPGALPVLAVVAVAAVLAHTVRRPAVRAAAVVAGCAAVVLVIATGRLERAGDWGITLWWVLAVVVAVHALARRRVPWRAAGLLALGVMASLSWGYDSPTLLGGSLALLTVDVLTREMPPVRAPRAAGVVAAVTVCVVTLAWMGVQRAEHSYRDGPYDELTADLGTSIPSMRWVRTSPETADYVGDLARCVERYPADRVAVLPDNAFVYPALGVRNPFPLDWPLTGELVADSRDRFDAAADALDDDFLVLFQTIAHDGSAGHDGTGGRRTAFAGTEVVDDSGIARGVLDRVHGRVVTCGSFVGVWAPPRR
ncbi:hypothetical protein [Rhodococcus sp. HNM0569]|uniref:hypothetical protein n=1 Tax=Rhodococcus sp. HNM0569 TaxID=2716340 RepID=UPI00146B004F|nr:hypothetical protein [Rhodococcus sp. HNM0569]NLU83733.1 hypothetical protein [Rhodococcus sp. HNM0569]